MKQIAEQVKKDMEQLVQEWIESGYLHKNQLFVIGCSTSEVAGEQIGTSGSEDIAAHIYSALKDLKDKTGVYLAFQCCEHLNRALVVEREVLAHYPDLEEVTVIPHPNAGGSMASYAYRNMTDPVVVEEIKAHAGMDIGDTMIGMHLKRVAVPLRFKQKQIGQAHLTCARTRPKLIGGERARYK